MLSQITKKAKFYFNYMHIHFFFSDTGMDFQAYHWRSESDLV
jgi:hypothetical protein